MENQFILLARVRLQLHNYGFSVLKHMAHGAENEGEPDWHHWPYGKECERTVRDLSDCVDGGKVF